MPGDVAAFEQRWHRIPTEIAGGEHLVAPVAPGDVQPHRAGGVRHIAGELAGHAQAQIILGQQHFIDWLNTAASCRCTHKSFGAVKPGIIRLPVICWKR